MRRGQGTKPWTGGRTTHVYITTVLDPDVLPIAEVVRIYARRWDRDVASRLVKRNLGLHLLWSAKWELILIQIWGVLLLSQIASALRGDVARRAGGSIPTPCRWRCCYVICRGWCAIMERMRSTG